MNPAPDPHEATPEFLAHLEWQIETALRRETRLAAPVTGGFRGLRTALIVVVALAAGGAVGMASGRAQDAKQRDRLVDSARSEESLVSVRLDLARADYQDERRRFDAGVSDRLALAAAEDQVRAMETALAKVRLDIEEIRATSATPNNDLQAPLVGQRDFVRERLALDLDTAKRTLVTAEQTLQQVQKRVSVGVTPQAAALQAEADVAEARARMLLVQSKIDIRQKTLSGEIKPEDAPAAARRMELTLQADRAQRELLLGRARLEELRRLVAVGTASQLDLKKAEVEVLERELELRQITQELQTLAAVRR
jgi:outer membrane protein TolC